MTKSTPEFVIIAGPNGAGKTTTASKLLQSGAQFPYINADEIYKSIDPDNIKPTSLHISAGKIAINAARSCIANRHTFVMETTLSGTLHTKLIQQARKQGFKISLFYVYLNSPELAIQRVKSRIALGGHSIPEHTIRNRYNKSLYNLVNAYLPIVDQARIVDNSHKNKNLLTISIIDGSMETVVDRNIWNTIRGYKI